MVNGIKKDGKAYFERTNPGKRDKTKDYFDTYLTSGGGILEIASLNTIKWSTTEINI